MAIYTNFGRLVSKQLADLDLTQESFSNTIGISSSYFNQTLTGARHPSAKLVEKVADGLDLSSQDRETLHYHAAIDNGFKLDLTKK